MADDHIHLARLKKGDNTFEVVIDPDLAMEYRKGKDIPLLDVLKNDKIWFDAHKGQEASHERLKALFEIDNLDEIAKKIIKEGDIQLTAEYREKKRKEKLQKILGTIQQNGVDPKTNLPHPMNRIEAAFQEAKIKVDEHSSAEDQMPQILRKLQPILPIKFVTKRIEITLLAEVAMKVYGNLKDFGRIIKEDWQSDGSWIGVIEIPGGLEPELTDMLNSRCHCDVQTRVLETR